jgi:hypothetical protein
VLTTGVALSQGLYNADLYSTAAVYSETGRFVDNEEIIVFIQHGIE